MFKKAGTCCRNSIALKKANFKLYDLVKLKRTTKKIKTLKLSIEIKENEIILS